MPGKKATAKTKPIVAVIWERTVANWEAIVVMWDAIVSMRY